MNFLNQTARSVSKTRSLASNSTLRVSIRCSTTALTKEEIEAGIQRAKQYKKHASKSTMPITLSEAFGTGEELHVPEDPTETAVFSGMPAEHANRKVLISQRQNKTLQSSDCFSHQWRITWQNSDRWSNPLMGWTSTNDPMSNVQLDFDTLEEAVEFAKRNGWKYETTKPQDSVVVEPGTHKYAHNFLPALKTLELKHDMDRGVKTQEFIAPGWGESQWFMPLRYHGEAEVEQYGPVQTKAQSK